MTMVCSKSFPNSSSDCFVMREWFSIGRFGLGTMPAKTTSSTPGKLSLVLKEQMRYQRACCFSSMVSSSLKLCGRKRGLKEPLMIGSIVSMSVF